MFTIPLPPVLNQLFIACYYYTAKSNHNDFGVSKIQVIQELMNFTMFTWSHYTSCPEPLNSLPTYYYIAQIWLVKYHYLFHRSHAALLFAFYCSVLQFYVCWWIISLLQKTLLHLHSYCSCSLALPPLSCIALLLTTWLHVAVLRYQDESYGVCCSWNVGNSNYRSSIGLSNCSSNIRLLLQKAY